MPPRLAVIVHFDVSRIESLANPVKLLGWAELGVATVSWQTTPTRKSLDGAPSYVVLGALKTSYQIEPWGLSVCRAR